SFRRASHDERCRMLWMRRAEWYALCRTPGTPILCRRKSMSRPPFESDNPAVPQHPAAPRSSESEPADALWWYRKGAAHLEARELDEAEDALRHAALLAPHDPRPLALLGRIYLLQARDTEAVEI